MHCIHDESRLCPACQADYDHDPWAYLEYGDYLAGLAAWEAFRREIAEWRARNPIQPADPIDDDVPL